MVSAAAVRVLRLQYGLVIDTTHEISTDSDALITIKENGKHESKANNILSPGLQREGGDDKRQI